MTLYGVLFKNCLHLPVNFSDQEAAAKQEESFFYNFEDWFNPIQWAETNEPPQPTDTKGNQCIMALANLSIFALCVSNYHYELLMLPT